MVWDVNNNVVDKEIYSSFTAEYAQIHVSSVAVVSRAKYRIKTNKTPVKLSHMKFPTRGHI